MLALIFHSIFSFSLLLDGKLIFSQDKTIHVIKISVNVYICLVVIFHAPVVCLQVYSQFKKLCEEETAQFEPIEEDDATTEVSTNF